jgi:hypothetical protein
MPYSPNTISINNANVELARGSGANLNMDNSAVRALFGKTTPQSTISLSDGWGKSATAPILDITLTVNTAQVGYSVKQAILDAGYPSTGKYRVTVIVNAPIGGSTNYGSWNPMPSGGGGGGVGFYSGGGWQSGESLKIINNSYIVAGKAISSYQIASNYSYVRGYNGYAGGNAIQLDSSLVGLSVIIDNTNGYIYGGGGSGGGGGGYVVTPIKSNYMGGGYDFTMNGQQYVAYAQSGGTGGNGAGFNVSIIADGRVTSGTTGQSGNPNVITTAWHFAAGGGTPLSWAAGGAGSSPVNSGGAAGGNGGGPTVVGFAGGSASAIYNAGAGGGGGGAGAAGGAGGTGWGWSWNGINGPLVSATAAGGAGGAAGSSVKNAGVSISWVYPGGNRLYGGFVT